MSFQIFHLVGHFTHWTGYNLLTQNTSKEITQDVPVRCAVMVPDHNVKLAISPINFCLTMSGERLLFPALLSL